MPDWVKLTEALEHHGFTVSRFPTAAQAAAYIDSQIDAATVGMGGSVSLREAGLYDLLSAHNTVHWHWDRPDGPAIQAAAAAAQVYLTSVNALAETGELINIDGNGNRVASTLYGHEAVYFLVGANKIAPDYPSALWRARNIAAPKNARRLGRETPCALRGDKCYDCDSPQRVCGALVTHWRKPKSIPRAEVVLVEEELGY